MSKRGRAQGSAQGTDVLVVGAGAVGSAVAYFCSQAGLSTRLIDRGLPGSGTSSHCEGNILVSDKDHGVELELSAYSLGIWGGELAEFAHLWEFERKGGIIVASRQSSMESLRRTLKVQRQHNINVEELDIPQLREREPFITDHAVGAAYYPDDAQVMPMKVVNHLVKMAMDNGAVVTPYCTVTGVLTRGERVTGVRTNQGDYSTGAVINACGPWAGELAALTGSTIPVVPRRGYVMVSEPMPPRVFHKVYAAEYIDNVGTSDASLQTSPVVESTQAGTILIGSSRERVGFDHTINREALRQMAAQAVELFPFLSQVRILRHYHGFRPYCEDHVPIIGPDPVMEGLWYATGHEGAGIGCSVATGKLMAQMLTGTDPDLDMTPMSPARFSSERVRGSEHIRTSTQDNKAA